jgi:multimeric flavodoxin WrbA
MHLILHDLPPERAALLLPTPGEALALLPAAPGVKPCVGCFQCWTKTPGQCVIPDRGQALCRLLARAERFTVVSRCCYGGLSPDGKAMIDRHIGYMLPYFHVHGGEMHHVPRYPQRFALAWHLYGDITPAERETARRYCAANARNMHAAGHMVTFCAGAEELEVPA